jgi:chitin synthase
MLVGAMNTAFGLQGITSFYINVIPVLFFVLMCFFSKNEWQILVAQIFSTLYAMLMLAVLVSTAMEISEEGIWSPSAFFFIGMCSLFVIAAVIHPQEFLCLLPAVIYLLTIPSMYLLLTIYSIINLNIVSWGTREVKTKLTAKEKEAQELYELENKGKKKKGFLSRLPIGDFGKGSHWGFNCVCCSKPKDEEELVHLNDIKNTLNSFNSNMAALKVTVENMKQPTLRRTSTFRKSTRFAENLESVQENVALIQDSQSEDEDDDEVQESTPMLSEKGETEEQKRFNESEPDWIKDEGLKKGQIVVITPEEKSFWDEFIKKYLQPLDEDKKHQEKVAADLIELRNKAVFAFGMINALFVLFVFLLQMHKDLFHINWPIGSYLNDTYNQEEGVWGTPQTTLYKTVQMDPIGLVLVAFFGSILVIQFFGMLFHRFGTIAHLLAFVEIECCSKKQEDLTDDKVIDNNAVQIAKELQKLKGIEELEDKEVGAFGYQKKEDYRLDVAFRKRIMSLRPDSDER